MTDTSDIDNKELALAFDYILQTNESVFLTGKAGTGKTTFLKKIKETSVKRIAVVAPTGVAAINAGGVTIHSMFQLSFSPFIPLDSKVVSPSRIDLSKYNKNKINLIRSIDLLVIDEISMVRCDVLDAIDAVCRTFRNKYVPFGGLQLLMIGDIHQLAPVVKDEEWQVLTRIYDNPFFFSSLVLKKNFPITIELKHIYRQSDSHFINILNKVRHNNLDFNTIEALGKRYQPWFDLNQAHGYITLTTHNHIAKNINQSKLDTLETKVYIFKAEIKDDFPEMMYPTDAYLELKIGAQVMFLRNDKNQVKRFYNGKIGIVSKIEDQLIYIKTDEHDEIILEKETWENMKYVLDNETKTLKEQIQGTFTQYPLKLAWAITIHKSQGLTFDKVIIDAESSFSSGQVYVALSRCTSLEGIVLISPITEKSIKSNNYVTNFNALAQEQDISKQRLETSKFNYQLKIITDIFNYVPFYQLFNECHKVLIQHAPPVSQSQIDLLNDIINKTNIEVLSVMIKFTEQIKKISQDNILPEENEYLKERLQKSACFFIDKIDQIIIKPLKNLQFDTENKAILNVINKHFDALNYAIFELNLVLKSLVSGLNCIEIIQIKSNAMIDFEKLNNQKSEQIKVPKGIKYPELYIQLYHLRNELSIEENTDTFKILPIKTLKEICNQVPTSSEYLSKIKGVGPFTIKKFGVAILELIQAYCLHHNIEPVIEDIKIKLPKIESKLISYQMYKEGKTVDEIAKERQFASSTIYSHLAHYIKMGELDIAAFIEQSKIELLENAFQNYNNEGHTFIKSKLPDSISYIDIRLYNSYLEFIEKNKS